MQASTLVGWHRKGFRLFWSWKIRHGKPGRRSVPKQVRELIRTMSRENPLWGAPRIHGELLKPGIDISEPALVNIWSVVGGHHHRRGALSSRII
jgi:putative transposase